MNQSFYLYSLQVLDTKIDRINAHLKQIEQTLASDKSVSDARLALDLASDEVRKLENKIRAVESDANELRIKLEFSEAALYGGKIRNPKELQDIQNEMASLKKRLQAIENHQLELMLDLETLQTQKELSTADLKKAETDFLVKNASLKGEYSRQVQEKSTQKTQQEALLRSLDAESVRIYTDLRRKKGGIAVAKVIDGACEACGVQLTPSEQQNARSPEVIFYCPSCGRIIYSG